MTLSHDFFEHIIREWNYHMPPVLQIVSMETVTDHGHTFATKMVLTDGVYYIYSIYRNAIIWHHLDLEDFEVIRLQNWNIEQINNENWLIIQEFETVDTPNTFLGNDVMTHAINAAI